MRTYSIWRVRLRLAIRWIVRRLTGRYTTVPLPRRENTREAGQRLIRTFRERFAIRESRRKDNRDLLTGMVVALRYGPNLPSLSGWERYRAATMRRLRQNNHDQGREVGRPLVVKFKGGIKVGVTQWRKGYITRKQQLAMRKAAKAAKRQISFA